MTLPTFKPNVWLPKGPNVVKVGTTGQSNAVGADSFYVSNRTAPIFARHLDDYTGRGPGMYDRIGAVFHNQSQPGGFAKKRSALTQAEIELTDKAGKSPILATIARSGTAIDPFINGGQYQAAYQQYAAELAATAGPYNWHWWILWGESDANALLTSLAFAANLALFDAQNLQPFFPGCRLYVPLLNINYSGPNSAWRDNVRACQAAFVAARPNSELRNWDGFGYGSPHYTTSGYISGGIDIATRVLAQISGASSFNLRPPPRKFQSPAFRRANRF